MSARCRIYLEYPELAMCYILVLYCMPVWIGFYEQLYEPIYCTPGPIECMAMVLDSICPPSRLPYGVPLSSLWLGA